MSSVTIHYCDVCRHQITKQNSQGETWYGHLKYRIYTPDGQRGEMLELCPEHAETVYQFIRGLE